VNEVRRNEKDAILFIGDGGFMTMLSGIIDLKRACVDTKRRALVLYFDDHKYGERSDAKRTLLSATWRCSGITRQ
jgi:TPP-dependent trihydroxycyclohexane-1,2-dione (THcHDO) dehydratase